jgi:F420-non-reducing hydrogenase iron-sulfur subunit
MSTLTNKKQETTYSSVKKQEKVIVFTCNWNAYSGLETAGTKHLNYSPVIYPLKVMCLGQLSPGIILKALEKGAAGILLLGCPPGECHFEFGNKRAEEVFSEVKELAALLGYRDEQCGLDWLAAGDGEGFVNKVEAFIERLSENQ